MAIELSSARMPTAEEILEPTPGSIIRRRIFGHTGLMVGGGVFLFIVVIALLAPLIAPHDPLVQDLTHRLVPPVWDEAGSWAHPFGTDLFGRDYLSRIMYGAQVSLMIGIAAMLISGIIGTSMGIAAGYFGGKIDMFLTFVITTRLALPAILVALAVVALVGSSLWIVITVLGLLIWDRFAVVMRSATQQIRNLDYVTAAEAAGSPVWKILLGEILPNIANALIVVATIEVAHAILLEAALSFLGLGVQPPTPSWGLMISEGKGHMFFKPWVILIPGVALSMLILSINLMGDGIRDVTGPRGAQR